MKLRFLIIGVLSLFSKAMFAQPAVGEWTDYQSYASAKNVVDTGTKIYCVTTGGLFSYSKTDNSIQKMTGINGLSDTGVERVAYSSENKVLLIAYQNANIDLLFGNEVFNLADIKRKQIPSSKTINNIFFSGKLAYLSCGFGIVVINLERKEIKDTYYIGNEGDYMNVLDMASDGNYLYAATANGVYKASANEPNLQNYANWKKETSIPGANDKFSEIEYVNGKIIANRTTANDDWAGDKLFQLNDQSWIAILPDINYVSEMTTSGEYLVVSSREEVFVYNRSYELVKRVNRYSISGKEIKPINTACAVLDSQNVLWIADPSNGLVKVGTQDEKIRPEGPYDNKVFSLSMNGSDLWVAPGGRDNAWGNLYLDPKFQLYRAGKWSVFDRTTFEVTNDFRDIVCVVPDPKNQDRFFAGSWGGGVLEFNSGKFTKRHDNLNSSLQTQLPAKPTEPYVRIGGMAFDKTGNLWVANSGVEKIMSVYQTDGTWKSFSTPEVANKYSIGKLVVTRNDDKWVVVPRAKGLGVFAMNATNDQTRAMNVVARFENSDGPIYTEMSDVYTIAEDLNGEIWIGTSTGVAVYSNPQRIWTESTLYATRPGVNLNDGFFHPLLEKETITAIAVDGANRKWIGTKSSGIFLVSENGDTELEHFNTDNSALPSDEILDIAINHHTGEVFIGTSAGIISYMGVATKGNDLFSDVYVYPNPVRESYQGTIVVKGLMDETDVKITTVSGNLVYKTTSLGGQAVWDGRNLNGNRCKTGVYLVFLTDPAGEQTKVTKLLFIH